MLIVQGLNVPCMAAPQKIRIVPNKAKKAVVTPKKPTKKGPTQKSNRSPPISVPPRTRYFFSKLSKAMRLSPRSAASSGGRPVSRQSIISDRCGGLEPVQTGRQNHQVDHRREKEQEDALRHEHAAGVENEPDLVELSHVLAPSSEPGRPDVRGEMSNQGDGREQPEPAHVHRVQLLRLLVGKTCEGQVGIISH